LFFASGRSAVTARFRGIDELPQAVATDGFLGKPGDEQAAIAGVQGSVLTPRGVEGDLQWVRISSRTSS
jgi:hypothetical protein